MKGSGRGDRWPAWMGVGLLFVGFDFLAGFFGGQDGVCISFFE